jgi:hypothetical protein
VLAFRTISLQHVRILSSQYPGRARSQFKERVTCAPKK